MDINTVVAIGVIASHLRGNRDMEYIKEVCDHHGIPYSKIDLIDQNREKPASEIYEVLTNMG